MDQNFCVCKLTDHLRRRVKTGVVVKGEPPKSCKLIMEWSAILCFCFSLILPSQDFTQKMSVASASIIC